MSLRQSSDLHVSVRRLSFAHWDVSGAEIREPCLCYPPPMSFPRITVRSDQMGGAPCIRGLRIPVSVVVDLVADGMSVEEILSLYPDLEREDIPEALRFAAEAVRERELPLTFNS